VGTGAATAPFEVGSASAYTPVDVAFGNVTSPGTLTAVSPVGDHPSLATSGINPNQSVNRSWTITNSGLAFDNYSITLHFSAGEVDAGANTGAFVVRKYDAPNWSSTTTGTRTATSTEATGLTSFSDFALGEPLAFTVTASAGANGAISPSGAVAVNSGASQAFTITPDAGYHVADLLVDGGSVGALTSYTFTNVTANHIIAASFAIDTYTLTASAGANGAISPS